MFGWLTRKLNNLHQMVVGIPGVLPARSFVIRVNLIG
jgi:hypothetical protein